MTIPINHYLRLGTKLSSSIKNRLFAEGILPQHCSVCGLGPAWNNKPLKMQVDHINGNSEDNTEDNLRAICPNCHSQTNTFGGKNKNRVFKFPSGSALIVDGMRFEINVGYATDHAANSFRKAFEQSRTKSYFTKKRC